MVTGIKSGNFLFATIVIPFRLVANNNLILWNNQAPQSIRLNRPLKLEYMKETKEHVLKEKIEIEQQIEKLSDFETELPNDKVLKINYKLYMTLIDCKILNILTNTKSSQACPICGATPQKFINIKEFRSKEFKPKPKSLQYGKNQLHSWIRFFECIVHISYRHAIEKWQVRDENRQLFIKRKQEE